MAKAGKKKGGSGGLVPTLTIKRERPKRGGSTSGRKGRPTAEHLLDLDLQEVTPEVWRVARGTRLSVLGPGPRLMVLAPTGVLGLASVETSEGIRAALAAAPGAHLDGRVTAKRGKVVRVSVSLVGADGVGGAQQAIAAPTAAGRRGR